MINKTLEFIKSQRISTSHKGKFIGIRDTLIGWSLVAINVVFLTQPFEAVSLGFSFIVFFFSAAVFLFSYIVIENLFLGNKLLHNLRIVDDTETSINESHLTIRQRIKWIYFRGLVATGGYICFNLAKVTFGVIDNASIFGADALIYAIFALWLLKEKFTKFHYLGLIIAGAGVFYVLAFDVSSFLLLDGIIAGAAGIFSAIALTIIFFITGVIVRHDTPKRVAFHQCICGLALSLLIFLVTLVTRKLLGFEIDLSGIGFVVVRDSILSGIIFGIALIFFLRAFLFTQPIIIAILGYSLNVFVIIFQSSAAGALPSNKDLISSILILVGCCFPLFHEYKKEKELGKGLTKLKPTYEQDLKTELITLRQSYQSGSLDKYHYLAEHHEFNKLLIAYSNIISSSIINEISIKKNSLVFSIGEYPIRIETDGSARSAPFEILSFGAYEAEDELVSFSLIKDGDSIFDVGAHLGWYSLNFAKRFPNSKIHAFEPVPMTYQYLVRNIELNKALNISPMNLGLLNEEKYASLVYFKGGSALASLSNLINHNKTAQVRCNFTTIDKYVSEQNCPVDFLKCDVEGAELFVIQGAVATIKHKKPVILMEIYEDWCTKCGYSATDISDFFENHGYAIFQSQNGNLVHCMEPDFSNEDKYNYFFLHLERHKDIIDLI